MRQFLSAGIVLLSSVVLVACSAKGGGGGGTGDGGGGGGGGETTHDQCGDGIDNDGDGVSDCSDPNCAVWTECGGSGDAGPTSGSDGSAPCAVASAEAAPTYAPVDIIWTIDNSGSMSEEASLVQEQLTDFTADIVSSGVDFRVVMITAAGFVTIDPALASDPMRFRRVEQSVNSHDAFEVTLASFGAYSDFLRPSARTHIVVVTDDESDTSEASFRTSMETMLGHPFIFHAIASEFAEHDCVTIPIIGTMCDRGCEGPRGDAADVGETYYRLATATGGTQFSICSVDWSPLWATLRDSVVVSAAVPCRFSVPEPPAGMSFDPAAVTVTFTGSSGGMYTYPRALDAARCTDAAGDSVRAWYYDDNDAPTQILLCPAACMEVESDRGEGARVDVTFVCEPQVVLI
jgi:hypothetical protein